MSDSIDQAVLAVQQASQALNDSALPFPVPVGNLAAVVAGTVSALSRSDWWVPGLRERCGAVLRDVPHQRLIDGFAGAKPYRVAPPSASPALRALTAVGLAMASSEGVAVVHLGIGSLSDGAFHEALNLAALYRARVVFVVTRDPLGPDAPIGPQTAADPVALASAYGIDSCTVSAHDASAVRDAVTAARTLAPFLVCADL